MLRSRWPRALWRARPQISQSRSPAWLDPNRTKTAIQSGSSVSHWRRRMRSRSKSKSAMARLATTQFKSARWPMRSPSLLGRSRNRRLFAPRLAGFLRCETMNCRGHAGAAPKRIFQVYRPAMFFQKIPKSLVGELLKVLHLIAAEKIDLPPCLVVDLHPLARHQPAFLCRAFARTGFLAVRPLGRDEVD